MNCVFFDLELIASNNGLEFEKMIENAEYRASSKYLQKIVDSYLNNLINESDYRVLKEEYNDLKDRLLEEVDEEYIGKIDFKKNYVTDESNKNMIDYINKVSNLFDTYVIFYYNTPRELEEKQEVCNRYFPNCRTIGIKYYEQKYDKSIARVRTNKAEYIMNYLGLTNLDNNMLVDKSGISCDEWNALGGYSVLERNKKISENNSSNILKMTR